MRGYVIRGSPFVRDSRLARMETDSLSVTRFFDKIKRRELLRIGHSFVWKCPIVQVMNHESAYESGISMDRLVDVGCWIA